MKSRYFAALLTVLAAHSPALGQTTGAAEEAAAASVPATPMPGPQQDKYIESPWRLGVALGYGLRTNPLIQSDDIPIIVDIDISWFGDHFFFDNGDLGLTFVDNEYVTTSLVGRINSDRVFFGRTNTKFISVGGLANGPQSVETDKITVPDRDYAGELGLELLTDGRWGQLQLSAFHDVSGTHEGYELEANYGYGWRKQRFYLEPSFGLSYKSAALNDYYWGVRADESNSVLPAYEAGPGINGFARLKFSYQVSRNWTFSFVGEVERLNDEAANSPIVEEQAIFGYFAGFGYRFH